LLAKNDAEWGSPAAVSLSQDGEMKSNEYEFHLPNSAFAAAAAPGIRRILDFFLHFGSR